MASTERPLVEVTSKTQNDEGGGKLNQAWQMEVLMERLRSKAARFRTLPESAKTIKQAVLKKEHMMDPTEKATMGKCLDTLQSNIKVTSLSAMAERLEAIARQLGLKFTQGSSAAENFISCDMYYVEVLLTDEGRVRDVKVELAGGLNAHEGQSSPELVECLSRSDFADFTAHLEGFSSIYQLNTDKKSKSKAYQALLALETDLTNLFELTQETIKDPYKLVLKSPVGLLQPRRGGHGMRLVYFVSPYELLDVAAGRSITLTTETPASQDLLHYCTVNIDASNSHKLQTTTLMNINKAKGLPEFSDLNQKNSITLPACFSLKLKKPMPMSMALIQRITQVTGIEFAELENQQPLLSLIIQQASDSQTECNNNRGLFVTLPDQQHCYFMTSAGDFPGVLVTHVPFTHPTNITNILMCLRAQAAFNSLIASCVRPASKQELDSAFMFEVTAASHEYISVTFEHPQEESTATVEIDLTDLSNVRCRLHTLTPDAGFCSDEYATKVLQRCLSIPVTMRAVMRKVAKEERKDAMTIGDSAVMMGGGKLNSDLNQNTKFLLNDYDKLGIRRDQMMNPHMNNLNNVVANSGGSHNNYYGSYQNASPAVAEAPLGTSPLAALGNAMNDASTPLGYGALLGSVAPHKPGLQQSFLGDAKSTKVRKKKLMEGTGKSPKYNEEVIIDLDDQSNDSISGDTPAIEPSKKKVDKLATFLSKRRSSSDTGAMDIVTSDLAALREQVYGAATAANLSKFNSYAPKEKDLKKVKKPRTDSPESRKSPIVLDLTETETTNKKSSSSSTSGGNSNSNKTSSSSSSSGKSSSSLSHSSSSSSSASLSAALLKRPGIEIIPIPGSNTPISIPSSITVTPVLKSSDDKYKDKKDRRDKSKDMDRRDKKRKREDSPSSNSSSGSSGSSGKPSKVQIISSNVKHSSSISSSIDKFKSDSSSKSGLSGISVKPSTPPYQSPSKKSSSSSSHSPSLSKSLMHNKVSMSPTHKSSKAIYSPSQSGSSSQSPKGSSSPKPSASSPKHPSMSPKHTSLGKPSMTALKSASPSPTFSKPSLSPKLSSKSSKDKERSSSSSPSRSSGSSTNTSSSSSTASSSSSSSKPKTSSSSSSSSSSGNSSSDKVKSSSSINNSEAALTITKVSTGETSTSSSLANSFLAGSSTPHTAPAALADKPPSFSSDKSKISPPKNRKASLSDIVDKLRTGVGNSSDALTIIEKKDKEQKDSSKSSSSSADPKKEEKFTVKTSGLKLTINKSKSKDGGSGSSSSSQKSSSSSSYNSSSPNSKSSVTKSGLKPGVISGPASKKPSESSLPRIPKLPPNSVSNVTATAISPLGTSLPMMQSSPLSYQRDRLKEKEKERDKERTSSSERPKTKESTPTPKSSSSSSSSSNKSSSGSSSSDSKKDSSSSNSSRPPSKDSHRSSHSSDSKRSESSESGEKISKSTYQSTSSDSSSEKAEKLGTSKSEMDSAATYLADSLVKASDSYSDKGSSNQINNISNKTATSVSSNSSMSSSSDMRSRDLYSQSQFKVPKDTKDELLKSKNDISNLSRTNSSSGGTENSMSDSLSSSQNISSSNMSHSSATATSLNSDKDYKNCSLDVLEKTKSAAEMLLGSLGGGPMGILPPVSQPLPKPPTPSSMGIFPPSPLVSIGSIKIVKSPAPISSPLSVISPHSVASAPSPCIIDDDLMDEALMGTRK